MKLQNAHKKVLLGYFACLTAVFLCMLAFELVLSLTGALRETPLAVSDFEGIDVEWAGDDVVITETGDAQLILHDAGYMRTLYAEAAFSIEPGEFQVYYSFDGVTYTEKQKVYTTYLGNGAYLFELPHTLRPLKSLRMDLGVVPSVTVRFGTILKNVPVRLSSWLQWLAPWVFYGFAAAALLEAALALLPDRVLSLLSRIQWGGKRQKKAE